MINVKKDSLIMKQADSSEVHAAVGSIYEIAKHDIPWQDIKRVNIEDAKLLVAEIRSRYPELELRVDHVPHGIPIEITFEGERVIMVTKGDGITGEVIPAEVIEWLYPLTTCKVDKKVKVRILLAYSSLKGRWGKADVLAHLTNIIRKGPTVDDVQHIEMRIQEMYVDAERVSIDKYWDYLSGPIPGLSYPCSGLELESTLDFAMQDREDYRLVLNGFLVDVDSFTDADKCDLVPFLIEV